MAKRRRTPLQLDGTDEQYFRTRETSGETPLEKPKAETPPAPPPKKLKPKPARTSNKSLKSTLEDVTTKGEIVSRIIHLGKPLSKRLHATAEKFSVPVDDLLYAARKKAIGHFRTKLTTSKKPVIGEFDKGGETLRIAVSLSEAEMKQLVSWFDPLNLGLATKVVSPLLTESLRIEVGKICDAAG